MICTQDVCQAFASVVACTVHGSCSMLMAFCYERCICMFHDMCVLTAVLAYICISTCACNVWVSHMCFCLCCSHYAKATKHNTWVVEMLCHSYMHIVTGNYSAFAQWQLHNTAALHNYVYTLSDFFTFAICVSICVSACDSRRHSK